jgi:hypothetical protein
MKRVADAVRVSSFAVACSLASLGAGLLGLASCGAPEAPPPVVEVEADTQPAPVVRPDDYLVLLDNSASIRGDERVILREAVKVLADAVLPGDRVGVITFDEDAELLLSVEVRGDQERSAIRAAVDAGVDFAGQYSDMRAGLALAAQQREGIFRGASADANIVVLSDGLLESEDHQPGPALDELLDLASRDLGSCAFYPIGLGDTTIHQPIASGRPETGEILMRDHLTARGGRFFHASSFDLVHAAVLDIFQLTKDAAASSEQPWSFAADESIERVVLAVPKRNLAGEELVSTRDLSLDGPDLQGLQANSPLRPYGPSQPTVLSWNSSYRYFDLITVEHPEPGQWTLRGPEAVLPRVAQITISHTKVQHDPLAAFYVNEQRAVPAWVYDDRSGQALERGLEVSVLVRQPGSESAPLSAPLESADDRFLLSTEQLGALGLQPGQRYEYCLRFRGTEGFFLRQTPWAALEALEPLVRSNGAGSERRFVNFQPGTDASVSLHLGLDRTRQDLAAVFGSQAPTATAQLLRFDEDAGQYQPYNELELELAQDTEAFGYSAELALPAGSYTLLYQLEGSDDQGRARSMRLLPERLAVVEYGLAVLGAALAALLVLVWGVIRRWRSGMTMVVTATLMETTKAGKPKRSSTKATDTQTGVRGPARFAWSERAKSTDLAGPEFEIRKRIGLNPFGAPTFELHAVCGDWTINKLGLPQGQTGSYPVLRKAECRVGEHRFEVVFQLF